MINSREQLKLKKNKKTKRVSKKQIQFQPFTHVCILTPVGTQYSST